MKRSVVFVGLAFAVIGSAVFALRLWSSVLHFDPAYVFSHQAVPTGGPLSTGVTILLVDGLRLDASHRMPALNALRGRGASIEATVGTPSFSRPGRATIVVGSPPDIHGVTTNRQKRAIPLDNLIRRVGAAGGTCRVAGSKIWSGLFGDDIARCGVYREGEGKEGPGMFVRQVPEIRSAQADGLAFVLEQPAMLRIADIISTDFAAHEYGGASPEYASEVARVDAMIADLVGRLDLSRETLVITADHGHRDAGGHGGDEPEVLAIPIVMAGAGVKAATQATARQADLAPTLAAILGVGLPTASGGQPIEAVILADDAKLAMIRGSASMQREAFAKAVESRLGSVAISGPASDWDAMISAAKSALRGARTPMQFVLLALIVAIFSVARAWAKPDPRPFAAGLIGGLIMGGGPIRAWTPVMSFSGINYDEMLIPFFINVMTLATVTALTAITVALLVGRFRPTPGIPAAPVADAGALGLVMCAVLAGGLVGSWRANSLLSPVLLPGPGDMVVAYSLTLALLSVSITTLLVMSSLIARERLKARSVQGIT